MTTSRLIIYPKDIAVIFDRSPRQARRKLQELKRKLNKQKHHMVTIREFCDFYNLIYDEVMTTIRGRIY